MNSIVKYLNVIVVALGVICLATIFMPVVKLVVSYSEYDEDMGYISINIGNVAVNGIKAAFGGTVTKTHSVMGMTIGEADYEFKFSIMNCLPYVAVVGVIGSGLLAIKSNDKKFVMIAVGCAVVAAILFFLSANFVEVKYEEGFEEVAKVKEKLGFGGIIGGVCSLLAAGAGMAKIMMDK